MITRCLFTVLLFAAASLAAKTSYTEKQVVVYAQRLDVSDLDNALSSQRLDEWLKSGPAHFDEATWQMSDCDVMIVKGVAPLCVKVGLRRGKIGGRLLLRVGTFRDGITGTPAVELVSVFTPTGRPYYAYDSEKLSDLPRLLNEVSQ